MDIYIISKLERHICTSYILYAVKTGAMLERISYGDRVVATRVAHYKCGCVVKEVSKVNPATQKRRGKKLQDTDNNQNPADVLTVL